MAAMEELIDKVGRRRGGRKMRKVEDKGGRWVMRRKEDGRKKREEDGLYRLEPWPGLRHIRSTPPIHALYSRQDFVDLVTFEFCKRFSRDERRKNLGLIISIFPSPDCHILLQSSDQGLDGNWIPLFQPPSQFGPILLIKFINY